MPRIYVQFSGLEQIGTGCKTAASRVDAIESDFQRTIRALDWDVKFEDNIYNTAKHIAGKLEKQITALYKYQEFIKNTVDTYQILDNGGCNEEIIRSPLVAAAEGEATFSDTNSNASTNERLVDGVKSFLKWLDKTVDSETAGVSEGLISYLESLCKYFTGNQKATDWFDFFDNSADLYTKLYDFLKDLCRNEAGDLFSIANQKKIEGVDIAGNIAAFTGAIFGAAESCNSENLGAAGIIGRILGTGDELTDIGKSVYELIQKGTPTEKIGGYSAADIYAAVVKSAVATVGQTFESIEKYSADGNFDFGDAGATAIDSAMEGFYKISELGPNDAVFGFIDALTGGNGEQDMSYAEKAAEGYKILANEAGKAIGKLWLDLFG